MGWDFEKAHSLFTPCVFANSSGKKKPLCYHFDQWNSCIFNFNQLSTIYQEINEDTAQ
jgi:hypothetical protein